MVQNQAGEIERAVITDRESHKVLVKATLVDVVHGYLTHNEAGPAASLIIFESQFASLTPSSRIRWASIQVRFSGDATHNMNPNREPRVVGLAPQGAMRLFPTEQAEVLSRSIFAGADVTATWERQTSRTRQSAMVLRGAARLSGRNSGPANAVEWFLGENEQLRDGVSCVLRSVVLLERPPGSEKFLAHVTITAHVPSGLPWPLSALRRSEQADDPIVFDPGRQTEQRRQPSGATSTREHIDRYRLGDVSLRNLAYVRSENQFIQRKETVHGVNIQASLAEQSGGLLVAGKQPRSAVHSSEPESAQLWEEGSSTDKMLLNFSKGQYEYSYKLKRFQSLSLFNLYSLQHRLVELERTLKSKIEQGKDTTKDAKALGPLLRSYRDAVKVFKDLAVLDGLPEDIVRATNLQLAFKLNDPYYSQSDDSSMFDLLSDPESDGVRKWIQKRLSHISSYESSGPEGKAERVYFTQGPGVEVETPGVATMSLGVQGGETKIMAVSAELPQTSVGISHAADKIARFLVALVGGAFLLAPMCELVYVQNTAYQIVSVVLWVLFFALTMAATSSAKNQELLAATAAYAAVLVVFVGQRQT